MQSILLLPGDGIGPEVVAGAAAVLRAVAARFGHHFELPEAIIGGAALRRGLAAAAGRDPGRGAKRRCHPARRRRRSGLRSRPTRRAGRRRRCWRFARSLALYANLRPARVWPGLEAAGPLKPEVLAGTDMLVVRELTGGLYYGEPRGIAADGSSAYNTMRYSRHEIERIARRAFDAARLRRQHVTSVDKANVLETSRLWRAGRDRGGAPTIPTSRSITCTSTRCAMKHRARAVELRRHRDREHVRRHPLGRSRRHRRLARAAAVGEPW